MRVFSMPDSSDTFNPAHLAPQQAAVELKFLPFSTQAFAQAHARNVPVFLLIGEHSTALDEPSLAAQLMERTVPVHLLPGSRPDVELLCQRSGILFSGEGTMPLCALLTDDALPYLAAPLPPAGFPLDPSRLFVWLSQADRRFMQNRAAFSNQAAQVLRSFSAPPLRRPFSPDDAAHRLAQILFSAEDSVTAVSEKSNLRMPAHCAFSSAAVHAEIHMRTQPSPVRWTPCSARHCTTLWMAHSSAEHLLRTGKFSFPKNLLA